MTLKKNLMLMALMVAAATFGLLFQPKSYLADLRPAVKLEEIVPSNFEGWRELAQPIGIVVNPQVQEKLSALYSQLLVRTYINMSGERIMLSIAYGRDQRAYMAVHYPEVCYPAQGFSLSSNRIEALTINAEPFRVRQLETAFGKQRYEPVTYWTTIGIYRSLGGFSKRLKELKYGLHGQIPDGLLFRVSSIGKNSEDQFKLQSQFIQSLLSAVTTENREVLTGRVGI